MTSGHDLFIKHDRVPVILTSNSVKLKQTKYLLSRTDTLGSFVHFLKFKGYISVQSNESVYIRDMNRCIPSYSDTIGCVYYHLKGADGYLRLAIDKTSHFE
jgi:hypothetical protein